MSSSRSGYQPLAQTIDEEEADVAEGFHNEPSARGSRNSRASIDLTKLDNAFKR